ncbi:MAG: LIC12162 family protein [Desulfovibrio sp.]|jgi:putative transferase (TIGR04331 family)|nr:LIC12162 family protein [Desulfovibrio sp.]
MDSRGLTLILGRMPEDADPQHCVAAGLWCFAGQEEAFAGWESRFTFAPEPLRDPDALELAAGQAKALYADNLQAIAARLCPHSADLPAAYWETLLTAWGIDVARQIIERWSRVKAMTEEWGKTPLHVPLLPENCSFSFQVEHDVTLYGALGIPFNHWLFSRLLEACRPEAWTREWLPPVSETYGQQAPARLKDRLRSAANNLLLSLPCPRLKGMSLCQSLLFSLALLHPGRGEDKSLPITATFGSSATGVDARLPLDPLPLFLAALPESLKKLQHPRALHQGRSAFARVASIQSYENTAYRQKLAIWRGRGNRLIYVQHGCGYGQTRTSCVAELVEYSQHAFITWGWSVHAGRLGNFIPLPYPQLARLAERRKISGERRLLFVGTEIPAFGYRLDSYPTPLQLVRYRADKERFFKTLGREIQSRALYRPYFPVPGTLRDAEWLLPRFPDVRLCAGPLLPQMLGCSLLVLDHPGTTLHEALAANIPTILYWTPEHWILTPEGQAMLDVLEKAGIWYCAPEKAAIKVQEVWEDPAAWWRGGTVQTGRKTWCAKYAMTVKGSENLRWLQTLTEL